MKVLQLGKFYPIIGGVEKVMFDLTRGLSTYGVECDMLCADLTGHRCTYELYDHGAHLICTPSLTKKFATCFSPAMILRLRSICNQYDIIHVHHPDPMAAIALFLSGYQGKVILHWHSDIIKQHFLLQFYLPLQNWLIKRADLILGTTPVYIRSSPYLQMVQEKTNYLPIGIKPLIPNPKKVRAIRNIYSGKKIVFSLGRLVNYKGFSYLIDAAKTLSDDYVVLIGGSGELEAKLRQQIDKSGLQKKVYLLGRIPEEDIASYYGACDLYCLSSVYKTEAFAIVQIEAMSCGKPVVSTAIPGSGVSWVNKDGASGLVVPPGDSKALGNAIQKILSDNSIYHKLSEGAFTRYKEEFSANEMIIRCVSFYKQVIDI